ncbi:MAG: serine/threonine-protein phosphatase [Myxococcales bacterium]|nr:serine/threonine-protein phosphatase [Myxococcales bacterium]
MINVKLTVFGKTDLGRVRTTNEDAFVVADLATTERVHSMERSAGLDAGERGILIAVSDGMGGAQAGEVASTVALHSVRVGMNEGSPAGASAALKTSVERANRSVWDLAHASGREGMGATLTALLVHDRYAYIAEIGDSRAYLLRNDRLLQLTRDQSYVQELVERGVLTPEQAGESDYKNIILQAVGLRPEVQVAMSRVELRRGDRFLVCSDGLSNKVPDSDLHDIMKGASVEAVCKELVDTANGRGGEDNITAVVLEVGGEQAPVALNGERVSLSSIVATPA